ncbi:MAG: hypothetical protein M3417_10120 [Actinomycetota bacterium]|nr:hypothetical protein [Actinomycetota bacterium]
MRSARAVATSAPPTRGVAVVACGRVLALGRRAVDTGGRRPRGRAISDVTSAGRWAAWIEASTRSRQQVVARVVVADLTLRRVARRFVIARGGYTFAVEWLDVALTGRGDLAWSTGNALVVEQDGKRRVVDDNEVYGLHVEDDATLVWKALSGLRTADLRPPGSPAAARSPPLPSAHGHGDAGRDPGRLPRP